MLLVFNQPLADARSLLGSSCRRLTRPAWPQPAPGVDFLRSFGSVRRRRGGGVAGLVGEERYGDARAALRLPDGMRSLGIGRAAGFDTKVNHVFRRFHSDGTMGHVDVGLQLAIATAPAAGQPSPWLALLREILELPVSVPQVGGQRGKHHLARCGPGIARHYLAATTRWTLLSGEGPLTPQAWWVSAGRPSLVVEQATRPWTMQEPTVVHPPHTRHVLDFPAAGCRIFHAWIGLDGVECSTWFVVRDGGDPEQARRLRIHLVKLHAERECLRLILGHLGDSQKFDFRTDSPEWDDAQAYFNASLKEIQLGQRNGIPQKELVEATRRAFDVALEGEDSSLEHMRRQVAEKIRIYVRKSNNRATTINNIQGDAIMTTIKMDNVTVTGDFNVVVARSIENSFNKAAQSDSPLKQPLQALSTQVAELAKELPPETAEQAATDLAALTSEALSAKPRRSFLEVTGEGLIEAAKTVAGMAGPIGQAVKAVLDLLVR